MSSSSFLGKTIARIVDRSDDYGGIDLIFTDGSGLRIEGDGCETSTVTTSPLSAEDRRREAREAEGQREKDRVWRLYREAREQEEARVKASLSTREYEAWMDLHRQGWRLRVMIQEEIQGAYLDLMRSVNRQLVGDSPLLSDIGPGPIIPVFKSD